jgi:hypothetical protein
MTLLRSNAMSRTVAAEAAADAARPVIQQATIPQVRRHIVPWIIPKSSSNSLWYGPFVRRTSKVEKKKVLVLRMSRLSNFDVGCLSRPVSGPSLTCIQALIDSTCRSPALLSIASSTEYL